VQRLDKGQNATEPHLYVYYVKNGRATDLASVLNRILTGAAGDQQQASTESAPSMDSGFSTPGSSQGGGGSSSSPTGSGFGGTSGLGGSENGGSGGSPQSSLLNAVNPAGAETSSTSTTTTTTTGQGEEAGLRITADESTNSLLILATDRQYRTIESALSRLDIAPLQVMLEAAVAEVQLNNDLQYGLQYYFARGGTTQKQNQLELSGNGTSTTTALATFGGATAATLNGFGYAFNGANIQMVLKALADITKITVVSSPKLLVLNNETAQLLVGNQVPISTSSSTSTIAANAPTINQISYQSTGVILKVTPRVNEGGLVTMDVSQEVSSVAATAGSSTASEAASPTISDRRINTTVAVQDGETVALGGMIQDNKTTEHYGIPYIQNIPYLGNMFRSTTNDHDRTELLVLITPHIIQSVQRMRDITTDLRSEMAQTAPSLVGNQ
jgi:general secretion pathway protein D